MLDTLRQLDIQISSYIFYFAPHHPLLNQFFEILSLVGSPLVIWIPVSALLWYTTRKNRNQLMLYFFIAFIASSLLVNLLLKNYFQRIRPAAYPNVKLTYVCPIDYGFPSGHAAAAFTGAVVLATYDPKRKWYYYLVAILISLSRIYLGCHYFIDVISGGIIGSMFGLLTLILKKKMTKN